MAREIFQVQAKDAVVRINEFPVLSAVQNLNWDPAFNEENLSQLGDQNYYAQSITPEISGSFDVITSGATVAILKRMIAKYNASGEFEGYLANIPTVGTPTKTAGPGDPTFVVVPTAQSVVEVLTITFTAATTFTVSGSVSGAQTGTGTLGTPFVCAEAFVTITGTAGATPADNTTVFEVALTSGVTNAGTLVETDLEYAVFDLIDIKRTNDEWTRAEFLPRVHMTTARWTADANGNASETYNFEGDIAEVYRGAKRDLHSIPVTRTNITTVTAPAAYNINTAGTAVAGEYVVEGLYIDEEFVPVSGLTVTAGAGGTVEVNAGGPDVKEGSRLMLVTWLKYTTVPAFPTITYPTTARVMKASNIDIFLIKKADYDLAAQPDLTAGAVITAIRTNGDYFLRAQSADISVDLRREALRQIKMNTRNNAVFYRAATFPLNVTASVTCLETDLKAWALIQNKGADDTLNLADFEGNEWQIVMVYYKNTTVVQVTAVLNARVSGRGSSIAVGGRAEESWSFTGSQLKISGAAV